MLLLSLEESASGTNLTATQHLLRCPVMFGPRTGSKQFKTNIFFDIICIYIFVLRKEGPKDGRKAGRKDGKRRTLFSHQRGRPFFSHPLRASLKPSPCSDTGICLFNPGLTKGQLNILSKQPIGSILGTYFLNLATDEPVFLTLQHSLLTKKQFLQSVFKGSLPLPGSVTFIPLGRTSSSFVFDKHHQMK